MSREIPHLAHAAFAAALAITNMPALAANTEAEQLREELRQTRESLESRIAALEARLAATQAPAAKAPVVERLDQFENRLSAVESMPPPEAPPQPASAMNPQMSLILGGTWARLSENPDDYLLQGFVPAGEEAGPGARSFSLGESEMTLSANVDPLFYGQATFGISAENDIEVEEAFVRSSLPEGFTSRVGRFFSGIGYLNQQHAHGWDFVDAPLVYTAMFGGQYKNEGAELRWLAPLDTFLELGAELGNGRGFPGADTGNGIGAWTLFASAGGDVGESHSWKAGMAWLHADATARSYEEPDLLLEDVSNSTAFSGDSDTWSVQGVWKWAPEGNSHERNLKLQGEYFGRKESGDLVQSNASRGEGLMDYRSTPSGWYLQGVYQFMPAWRLGLRYDSLDSGNSRLSSQDGVLRPAAFPTLAAADPDRSSIMLDWSPTEFSRLRLQFARDASREGQDDDQIYLQYIMSLGAHGAHQF